MKDLARIAKLNPAPALRNPSMGKRGHEMLT